MGADSSSIVACRLRVRGVEGLRVAAAVGEFGLFLWMSLALAFSLWVTAGFFVS